MGLNPNQTHCLESRPLSNSYNIVEYEKFIHQTRKVVEFIKSNCSICIRIKSELFMTNHKVNDTRRKCFQERKKQN